MSDDFTEMFNTQLSPEDEAKFQGWIQQSNRGNDLYDYDLRGAFAKGILADGRGHLPDTFKKPNHPTFSTESQYADDVYKGGNWEKGDAGGWTYRPSSTNLIFHGAPKLIKYFQDVEPESQLVIPRALQ